MAVFRKNGLQMALKWPILRDPSKSTKKSKKIIFDEKVKNAYLPL